MMNRVTPIPEELLRVQTSPCISIYMQTSRCYPENAQDPLRFKNLVSKAESDALKSVGKRVIAPLIERLRMLQEEKDFWNHTLEGLAIFVSPDYFKVFKLQQAVNEQAYVSDVFFIKPLIRIYQMNERFQVLALTKTEVHLFEGNRYRLDEIEMDREVPKTMIEALGTEITPPHMTIASYGGVAQGSFMRHGHSSRKDEEELDEERFFRAVDHAITERHSKPSGLPLILAALPQHQSVFRSVSRNPHLLEDGIAGDPRLLETDALRELAWKVLEPQWQRKIDGLLARFEEALSKALGSDNPFYITEAALAGNVSVLLLDQQRIYPGGIDAAAGDISFSKMTPGNEHDVLEDLAITVLGKGGEVLVLPPERMPTVSGVAAIFRHE
ncbi:hypothetical protein FGF66_07475 [Chlorobaculum thiosulfatiphilum]|uniref:Uncharacterized protein n=2 Tax=Chlorobaculum thiosulfatiphilum TaxID=115852 RepID=A0A5C4S636_CHLTI|nr:hypothetical protein FGF66_07475 [Chlorobaculum thiosulfatiphilum]